MKVSSARTRSKDQGDECSPQPLPVRKTVLPIELSCIGILGGTGSNFPHRTTLALATSKRVSDLQALSTSPECMNEGNRVTLKPNMAFVTKTLSQLSLSGQSLMGLL